MMMQAAYLVPSTRLRLVVPGIVAERPRVLRFVAGACRASSLPVDIEHALVSAVGEAFNHAVFDSYADEEGTVTIELELDGARVVVSVRDRGAGVGAGPDSNDGSRHLERRYGLFIILRAMDEARWWREGDENVVTLIKRLPRGG
jgi:anti-sigma regulatory factor (Ser/Thr protein kinase)